MIKKLLIGLFVIIIALGIYLYLETNKRYENYRNISCNYGDTINYNSTSLIVNDSSIVTLSEMKENYDVSESTIKQIIKDYGESLVYAVYRVEVSNDSNNLCYLDFTHFTIEVDDWFSWMSRDCFREMNPRLNKKSKVCLYPGVKLDVFLPFMLYHYDDKDNFIYKQLSDGSIKLNLGIYPQKYYLNTRTKNFRTEGL